MALSRVFCFLPFFLLGYYFNKEIVDKIRRIPKAVSAIILIAVLVISAFIVRYNIFGEEVLFLRKPYSADSELNQMFFRILVYIIAVVMTLALINLVSAKGSFLTGLGTSTLTVYILHIFTIPLLEKLKLFSKQPYLYLVYSLLMTMVIVFIFSRPFVYKTYIRIMDKLEHIVLKRKPL